jgi:hypothetical protein
MVPGAEAELTAFFLCMGRGEMRDQRLASVDGFVDRLRQR